MSTVVLCLDLQVFWNDIFMLFSWLVSKISTFYLESYEVLLIN